MADTVIVLEPGEERAQKIAKAMASQTAGDILRFIGDGQKTSTEISEALSLPMNTAKYHIENLLEAGLISVAATKYSVKGREVKVYTLTNQLLIVAPRQSSARSLLLKYASLFGILAFASVIIAMMAPVFLMETGAMNAVGAAPQMAVPEPGAVSWAAKDDAAAHNFSGAGEIMAAKSVRMAEFAAPNVTPSPEVCTAITSAPPAPAPAAAPTPLPSELTLAFLLGGSLVIFVLLCYEVYVWRRMKGKDR